MPQIFTPSADTWPRVGVGLGIVAVTAAILLGAGLVQSAYVTSVDWVVDQPVPFSHLHHAGELGIDCRYCHAGVESAPNAGLPATEVCMTCHSQIWTGAPMLAPVRESLAKGEPLRWNRVARLPDYAYFDHSIHVSRGVPCVECHGRVDEMPLMKRGEPFTMAFCLDCHRDPAPHLRPPDQVTRMDWSDWTAERAADYGRRAMEAHHIEPSRLDDCGVCHR
ncbi:cytochrome c3 family protein [Amaricoccus solimangrovi]|uniref:Cytochrome c3 family protein n=1 Tax=Amaricoccus solimangrovi TaxID=2589815 RepID=A0A501WNZ8_9RHOB|nr:cytochrome c3 family protein [Amaricoccus solimangrovi]TPE51058.1 cytochrome c3 family protein [Amaricoccus solimangrovi]